MKKFYSIAMSLLLAAIPAFAQTATSGLTLTPKKHANVNPLLYQSSVKYEAPSTMQKAQKKANATKMTLGYCAEDPYTAYGLALTGEAGLGICLTKEKMAQFVGAKITQINFCSPVNGTFAQQGIQRNTITSGKVYIMDALNGTPLCETDVKLSTEGFAWNNVTLSTPYEIKGDTPIYLCVVLKNVTAKDYIFDVDGYAANPNACYVYSQCTGEVNGDKLVTSDTYQWVDMEFVFGSNFMVTATVEGDNLPQNMAMIGDDSYAPTVQPGQPFTYAIGVVNQGANPVTDVDVEFTIAGEAAQTAHANVTDLNGGSTPVNYDEMGMALTQFTCAKEGMEIPFTVKITKVNGVENALENSWTGTLRCLETGYVQKVVCEELTSAKCGYCPIGITGLAMTKEAYPDRFIPIAVHGPFNGADQMNVCAVSGPYYSFLQDANAAAVAQGQQGAGAPTSYMNRDFNNNVYPHPQYLEEYMESVAGAMTSAEVTAKLAAVDGNSDALALDVEVNCSFDTPGKYGITYTLVEDGVGPYNQTNYYAGQSGNYYGWEKQPSSVPTVYNEVARRGSVCVPEAASYIENMEKGCNYKYSTQVNTRYVTNKENGSIVVMLVNRDTKAVVNAASYKFSDFVGIEGVEVDKEAAVAVGLQGAIRMIEAGNIFTIDGRAVAAGVQGMVNVPAGIYLVATPAGNAKVVVR
ncbi:MAG: hypothetical protein NC402_04915 [Prevotella sp.]|nr:hypothetical protein [Prevotella sp.]MCM1075010.1 hypothetical protein [Ruminococcus sp.]